MKKYIQTDTLQTQIDWENIMKMGRYAGGHDTQMVTMKRGVIPIKEYEKIRDTNECPDGWSGYVSGPRIKTISTNQADCILLDSSPIDDGIEYYVEYYWPVVYSEWFKDKIEAVIEPLRKLKTKYENARIVFGFDN